MYIKNMELDQDDHTPVAFYVLYTMKSFTWLPVEIVSFINKIKLVHSMVMILKKEKCQGMLVVQNMRGLHTRPSTEVVKCASKFKSEVTLTYQKQEVNAKSLLGVLMLAASKGAKITVDAYGEDAEEVVESLIALAQKKFNIQY